jgi:ribose transport system permease protein
MNPVDETVTSEAELGTVEPGAVPYVGERTRRDRLKEALGRSWLLLFLIALVGYFWVSTPSGTFLTGTNLEQIALNTSEVILLAIGMTFVIVTAGIDLSIGGILFFSAVAGGEVMLHLAGTSKQTINGQYPHSDIAVPVGIAVCILAGTTWGVINGTLITKLRLPPFIVTLGTFGMTFGFGDLISGGSYLPAPVPPALSSHFGSGKILGLYAPIYVAVFFLVVAHVVLHHTRFGRYTAAIGSNEEGARRTGIAVDRHLIKVYGMAGFLGGVAAVLDLAIFTNTTSVSHQTDNLSAIGAVVIGGTSLFGGVGTVLGSAVGAFIPTVLQNGLVIEQVQPFWQEVVVGAAIILAVYVDQVRRRRANA